jgi:UTP--glucose-1-phosphate uridylyltransferase
MFPAADTVQKGMLPLVDRDGLSKPMIQIIAEEALDSGIEEICVVCAPGDEEPYQRQLAALRENLLDAYKGADWARTQAARLDNLCKRLSFVVQEEPLGYGHAVLTARDFVGDDAFLLLLSDHLYVSDVPRNRCAQQVLKLAQDEACAVAAVRPTREHLVRLYGTLCGLRVPESPGVYQIEKIVEKPSVSLAEMELQTPGLRAGNYLCFFGMHVLPHTIMNILHDRMNSGDSTKGDFQLTPALDELAHREKYLALEVKGSRYDASAKFGVLHAQIALAMDGDDRDHMLADLVELIAESTHRWTRDNDE